MKDKLVAYVTTNKMDCRIYKTTLFDNPIFAVYLDGEKQYCDSYELAWQSLIEFIIEKMNPETASYKYIKKNNPYYQSFVKSMGVEAADNFFRDLDTKIDTDIFDKAFELGIE